MKLLVLLHVPHEHLDVVVIPSRHQVALTDFGADPGRLLEPAKAFGSLPLQRNLDEDPDGGDLEKASFWTGLRPMTPDGTPIVGPTPFPNLYTNTGHGTLGWTMACGSARVLADVMSGRPTKVDLKDLALARYDRAPGRPK